MYLDFNPISLLSVMVWTAQTNFLFLIEYLLPKIFTNLLHEHSQNEATLELKLD